MKKKSTILSLIIIALLGVGGLFLFSFRNKKEFFYVHVHSEKSQESVISNDNKELSPIPWFLASESFESHKNNPHRKISQQENPVQSRPEKEMNAAMAESISNSESNRHINNSEEGPIISERDKGKEQSQKEENKEESEIEILEQKIEEREILKEYKRSEISLICLCQVESYPTLVVKKQYFKKNSRFYLQEVKALEHLNNCSNSSRVIKLLEVDKINQVLTIEYLPNSTSAYSYLDFFTNRYKSIEKKLSREYKECDYDKRREKIENFFEKLLPSFAKNCQHIIDSIAKGLIFLHENGVVHGDLKAENVIISFLEDINVNYLSLEAGVNNIKLNDLFARIGQVKIIDFESSFFIGSDICYVKAPKNHPVTFIAPEYIEEGIFYKKSDVYSFGQILIKQIYPVFSTSGLIREVNEDNFERIKIEQFQKELLNITSEKFLVEDIEKRISSSEIPNHLGSIWEKYPQLFLGKEKSQTDEENQNPDINQSNLTE